ncbi:hypothetical protein G9A89_018807 [Geosiphon pyriformis]|nr:hypothetical protein G9A89_018807 [Geosiphon pyriformis]
MINLPPVSPINKQQQQQPQSLFQQQFQQQLQQQPQQQPNLDLMAYAPIAKLEKFTGKEDTTQVWLDNVEKAITANRWNDARVMQAISYFFQDIVDS